MSTNGENHPEHPGNPRTVSPIALAPAKTRLAFGLLERFAPPLGGLWADRLWFTRPDLTGPLRLPGDLTPGERFEVRWSGRRIVGESWGAGPAVYLVHGWGGWRGHLGAFVKPLVATGHRVLTFDMPSHNESEPGALGPGRTTGLEFAQALRAVVDAQGPARAIIAHSLGAISTAVAMARGLAAERVVFLAPMADTEPYLDLFEEKYGFGSRVRARLRRRIARRLRAPLYQLDVVYQATQLAQPPPLLTFHDPEDREAPYATSEDLVRVWPGAALVPIDGLGRLAHYRILRNRQAIRQTVDFLVPADEKCLAARDGVGANHIGTH
jgi:pimeloyl-ACP methyl ester carboxylesterase